MNYTIFLIGMCCVFSIGQNDATTEEWWQPSLNTQKNVSNALIKYDVFVRTLKEYEALQTELANQFNQHVEKLWDPVILNQAKKTYLNKQLDTDTVIQRVGKLNFSTDIEMQILKVAEKKIFLKYIYQIKTIYLALRRDNILEKKLAEVTLALIIKEYHLN